MGAMMSIMFANSYSKLYTRIKGASLVETMATTFIAIILLVVGIPSLIEFHKNTRRDDQVIQFRSSLTYARSEASKRGIQVTLCPSFDGVSCNDLKTWEQGWLVFLDSDQNELIENESEILRRFGKVSSNMTIRTGKKKLAFHSTGVSTGFNDTIRICDSRGKEDARSLILSNSGRVRISVGTDTCP